MQKDIVFETLALIGLMMLLKLVISKSNRTMSHIVDAPAYGCHGYMLFLDKTHSLPYTHMILSLTGTSKHGLVNTLSHIMNGLGSQH